MEVLTNRFKLGKRVTRPVIPWFHIASYKGPYILPSVLENTVSTVIMHPIENIGTQGVQAGVIFL